MTTWFAIRQRQWCVARLAYFPFSLCLLASLLSSEALPAQAQAPQQPGAGPAPGTGIADRTSDYIGATISYSFGQAWYLDLSYARGRSSATGPIRFPNVIGDPPLDLTTTFTIDDDWYQAYVRYTFPALRFTRLSAYLRAGVSFVQADLHASNTRPASLGGGFYEQTDQTEDILGNVGFGLVYFVSR